MRMSIRWKMLFWIGAPVILIYSAMLGLAMTRWTSQAQTRIETNTTRTATLNARYLDARLGGIAQIAKSTADILQLNSALTQKELFKLVRDNVKQDPLVYGACIAFEPNAFDKGTRLFAPYAHRDQNDANKADAPLRTLSLGEAYDYTDARDPKCEWYVKPKASGKPCWSAPYFDKGAGDILMCTYSMPFYRRDNAGVKTFWGIATIDIAIEGMQNWAGLEKPNQGFFLILSPNGTFISHPDKNAIMKESVFSRSEQQNRPDIAALGKKMIAGESGVTQGISLSGEGEQWVSYAPIPEVGWSFCAIVPEKQALASLHEQVRVMLLALAATLVAILICILLATGRISSPIRKLAKGVRQLSTGDLETQVSIDMPDDEVGELSVGFNRMVGDLKSHIQALTRETAARQAVESELDVARQIQTSLLPRIFPPYPNRPEFSLHAMNAPARHVAGDFFDFLLHDDRYLYFLIADVSGKGVPAALYMAVTRTILRNQFHQQPQDPGKILQATNELLAEDNPGSMFVTLFLGIYDIKTGDLSYCNAGHPYPFCVKTDGTVAELKSETDTILGIIEDEEYHTYHHTLELGERLILFTDGVTEAQNGEGEFLEEQGLADILNADAGDLEPKPLCDRIVQRVVDFEGKGPGHHSDDVTVLVFQRNQ